MDGIDIPTKKERCSVCKGTKTITTMLATGGTESHQCLYCDGTGLEPKPHAICSRCHSPLRISFGYEEITCPKCGAVE